MINMTSINDDMDSSLLDVSADIISETPKKKPTSPWSFAKDVVKCLAIVTPTSGRVDAAKSLSSNTVVRILGLERFFLPYFGPFSVTP